MLKKIFSFLVYTFALNFFFLSADNIYELPPVYNSISDITNPTLDDFRLIQNYLTKGERSIIRRLDDYEPNARFFRIIGNTPDEMPQYGLVAVNCDENSRENCVVCYSSFNKNYPRGLKRLIKFVSESDFKGHILFRFGGWPNLEEGSLILAHVPYAFKVCMLKEARNMGFKRAFWLDTAILPVVSLNDIFQIIEDKGFFIMGNSHEIGPYMHPEAANAFGLTIEETYKIPSCSAGISGFDFTNKTGNKIVDLWYQAALNPIAFFSPRSDQNALSVILYNLGLSGDLISISRLAHNRNVINADTLLLIEREFVNELSLKPGDRR